jgi:hypothetical protein
MATQDSAGHSDSSLPESSVVKSEFTHMHHESSSPFTDASTNSVNAASAANVNAAPTATANVNAASTCAAVNAASTATANEILFLLPLQMSMPLLLLVPLTLLQYFPSGI